MRDRTAFDTERPRRPRAIDPDPNQPQRDPGAEMIRKARIATAIHMALRARAIAGQCETR